jgi:hypothetical protein
MKWEYWCAPVPTTRPKATMTAEVMFELVQTFLNDAGEQGWELVQIMQGLPVIVILKRKK